MTDRPPIPPSTTTTPGGRPADDLGRRLTELRPHVVFPPAPDLAASVRADLDRRGSHLVAATRSSEPPTRLAAVDQRRMHAWGRPSH